jgi:hypothetical protein
MVLDEDRQESNLKAHSKTVVFQWRKTSGEKERKKGTKSRKVKEGQTQKVKEKSEHFQRG